jgi:hypothetical protein
LAAHGGNRPSLGLTKATGDELSGLDFESLEEVSIAGGGVKNDVTIRLEHKAAKKLMEAMGKVTFDKLTPAQADAIEDFVVELQIQVMCE